MRRCERLFGAAGYSLAETLVSLALLAVLFAAMSMALAGMMRLYHAEIAALELLAQTRFAAQSIHRDLSYAERVEIGAERIVIFTRRNDTALKKIVYTLDAGSKYRRLMKDGQPVTGDSVSARISIAALRFARAGERVVCIELMAVDVSSGRAFSIETAAFMRNAKEAEEDEADA